MHRIKIIIIIIIMEYLPINLFFFRTISLAWFFSPVYLHMNVEDKRLLSCGLKRARHFLKKFLTLK